MAEILSYSVLGLDPGLNCTGYCLLRIRPEGYGLVNCGTFRTSCSSPLSLRLKAICSRLEEVLTGYHPDEAALEETFMAQNARSALLLGHIRGALLLTVSRFDIPVFEYSPREMKKAVVGYGAASKEQVRSMLPHLLRTPIEQYPLDATDAIGVAICHVHAHHNRITQADDRASNRNAQL
ncbi:MAG: crossover junction endodeoxyribonuclease RuvC [bacterium]